MLAPSLRGAALGGRGVPAASALVAAVVLLGTVVLGAGSASAATATPAHPVLAPETGSYVFTLRFDGLTRDYRLHVPPAAAAGKPLPLVLNLHGATQNAQLEEITTDMDPNADRRLPGGLPRRHRISTVPTPDPSPRRPSLERRGVLRPAGDQTHERRRLPAQGHRRYRRPDTGRPPPCLRDRHLQRRDDGLRHGGGGLGPHRRHLLGVGAGRDPRDPPHPVRPTMESHSVDDPIAKFYGTPTRTRCSDSR